MYDQAMPPSRRLNQKDETQNTYIHTYDSKNTIKVKQPGPEVINHCSCSTQLSIKFILLINVKMPTQELHIPINPVCLQKNLENALRILLCG